MARGSGVQHAFEIFNCDGIPLGTEACDEGGERDEVLLVVILILEDGNVGVWDLGLALTMPAFLKQLEIVAGVMAAQASFRAMAASKSDLSTSLTSFMAGMSPFLT